MMASPSSIERGRRPFLLVLAALLLLEGCAADISRETLRETSVSPRASAARRQTETQGRGGGFPEQKADPFQEVQEGSGL